jgi:hypothetical protein
MPAAFEHRQNTQGHIITSREANTVTAQRIDIGLAEFDFDDVFTLGNPQPKLKSVVEVHCRCRQPQPQLEKPRMMSYDSTATSTASESELELSGVAGCEFR